MTPKEAIIKTMHLLRSGKVTTEMTNKEVVTQVLGSWNADGWISVEDRKPELKHSIDNQKYSDTVIVTDGKYRTSARWVHNTWAGWYGWYDDGEEDLKGITQWMPMPEPPKKGGQR